jgi:hypothetical protein
VSTAIEKNLKVLFEKIARPAQVQIQQSRAQKQRCFCVEPAKDLERPSAHAGKNRQRSSRPPSNMRKLTTLGQKADDRPPTRTTRRQGLPPRPIQPHCPEKPLKSKGGAHINGPARFARGLYEREKIALGGEYWRYEGASCGWAKR